MSSQGIGRQSWMIALRAAEQYPSQAYRRVIAGRGKEAFRRTYGEAPLT